MKLEKSREGITQWFCSIRPFGKTIWFRMIHRFKKYGSGIPEKIATKKRTIFREKKYWNIRAHICILKILIYRGMKNFRIFQTWAARILKLAKCQLFRENKITFTLDFADGTAKQGICIKQLNTWSGVKRRALQKKFIVSYLLSLHFLIKLIFY